jgi:hypothetical protein
LGGRVSVSTSTGLPYDVGCWGPPKLPIKAPTRHRRNNQIIISDTSTRSRNLPSKVTAAVGLANGWEEGG